MKENRINSTIQTFRSGYNCAQAIFSSYCDIFSIKENDAKSIAAGFGAGFGRLQKSCGAITGAIMLISLRYYDENNHTTSKDNTYSMVRDFITQFEDKYKYITCYDLIGVDLSTNEKVQKAKEDGLFESKCEKYIRGSCELLESVLF